LLTILQYLKYINLSIETISFIFLLLFYKKVIEKEKRIFFVYALITTIFICLAALLVFVFKNQTAYFNSTRIYNVIEFSLLSFLLFYAIEIRSAKRNSLICSISFFLLCLYDFFSSKTPSIPLTPLLVESLFFILLIIYFFYKKIKQETNEPLFTTFIFWFAVAFLIFFSGNFLLFVYSKTSDSNPDYATNFTIIYSAVTILKNFLLSIAVLVKRKDITASKDDDNFYSQLTL
jgi:hypothetical protein